MQHLQGDERAAGFELQGQLHNMRPRWHEIK